MQLSGQDHNKCILQYIFKKILGLSGCTELVILNTHPYYYYYYYCYVLTKVHTIVIVYRRLFYEMHKG